MSNDFDAEFQKMISEFDIHNYNEIHDFVMENKYLLEHCNDIILMIKKCFPESSYSLEFHRDDEFDSLNQLVIYIHVEDEDFENEWEKLKKLNEEIREAFGNDVKKLISVDLW